ncbi:uncharacterized protein LOC129738472 [Uranotaenia lowii]|uniref:uncharacterized protein LOC129738472 n=1 Tax=Uranotaenia lowii TaxID=190385 RepID=UPI002478CE18|nr:uncharacterized protein LOC129738472 [Uranotaenia lowii]
MLQFFNGKLPKVGWRQLPYKMHLQQMFSHCAEVSVHTSAVLVLGLVTIWLIDPGHSEWVEIPFLQPSSAISSSTTPTTSPSTVVSPAQKITRGPAVVVRRNQHVKHRPSFMTSSNFIRDVLPEVVASEVDNVSAEDQQSYHQQQYSTGGVSLLRKPRPRPRPGSSAGSDHSVPIFVNDRVDFQEFAQSAASVFTSTTTTTSTTESSVIHSINRDDPQDFQSFRKRFHEYSRINVSDKLSWVPDRDEPQSQQSLFVTGNRRPQVSTTPLIMFTSETEPEDDGGYPQPLPSNKYEEESIEYLNLPPPDTSAGVHHVPLVVSNYSSEQDQDQNQPHYSTTLANRLEFRPVFSSSDSTPLIEESSESGSSGVESLESAPPELVQAAGGGYDIHQFHDFDDYEAQEEQTTGGGGYYQKYLNDSSSFTNPFKRKRRPTSTTSQESQEKPSRVTIVRVIPPRRRIRPIEGAAEDLDPQTTTAAAGAAGGFVQFLKFLKRMQDGFMLKTAKTIGEKIKVLQKLKDQILLSIEKRMRALWGNRPLRGRNGTTNSGPNRRQRRSFIEAGGEGMEFPSAEGALMTISFLTFAVFLIKLVLQVINTIKAKHYTYNMLTGLTGAVNPATLKIVKRIGRAAGPQDSYNQRQEHFTMDEDDLLYWNNHNMNIFSAINDFKFSGR